MTFVGSSNETRCSHPAEPVSVPHLRMFTAPPATSRMSRRSPRAGDGAVTCKAIRSAPSKMGSPNRA